MPLLPDLERCKEIVGSVPMGRSTGVLTHVVGLLLECEGLSSALGDLCQVRLGHGENLELEVVGFRGTSSLLMPLGEAEGLQPGSRVIPLQRRLSTTCSPSLLGRVVDGLGRPIDGMGPLDRGAERALMGRAPSALDRVPIIEDLPVGISVIDGLLTLGRGQRIGIFAGSGVGKTTLLGDMARGTRADVNVIALIGERGREVRGFIDDALGPEGLTRSVIVVATSDMPPLIRIKASFTAVAIAEYFRDEGRDVMLMMDSVTRLAAATREVGLALGEPPTVKGYPPSFFSTMPKLVERLGRTRSGSITGILTVLVDGEDMDDPVADTMRGLLDGHIVLSRAVAQRATFPAVDVLQSVSRVMNRVVTQEQVEQARDVRGILAVLDDVRDLVAVGAYKKGADPKVDRALDSTIALERLLCQPSGEIRLQEDTLERLSAVARRNA